MLQDMSNMNATMFDCMDCMLPYLPSQSFDTIPDSSLQNAMANGDIKSMKLTSRRMVSIQMQSNVLIHNKTYINN